MRKDPAGDPATTRKFLQKARPEPVGWFNAAANLCQTPDDRFGTFHPGQSHERRHILQAGGLEATPEWRDMARCTQPAEEGRHDRNLGRSPPEFNACLLLLSDVGSRL
jgi:hypothetical protein